MIRTAKDKRIADLRAGVSFKGFPPDLVARAQRRLAQLDAATGLNDLRVPPSNRLEMLKGDRAGTWSIRINDQWRVCFVWKDGDAYDVEIADYHRG
jgi:toxin HigB-1